MQNNMFWGSNPQSQPYNHYQGINPYEMNLVYDPSYQRYFFVPFLHQEMMPQLLVKNASRNFNNQIQNVTAPQSYIRTIPTHSKLKTETNEQYWIKKSGQTELFLVKTQQIQHNQQSNFQENVKVQEKKEHLIEQSQKVKLITKQEKQVCTRKEPQQPSKASKHYFWKEMDEQTHLDGVQMIKEFSRELIIYILKNEDAKGEVLQTVKNEIAQLLYKKLKKSKQIIHESLDHVTKILSTKFSKFKKTKEEMIKYIFRRIFNVKNKPEELSEINWRIAQKIHKKNSSTFKSMNMKFVEKQFQNPLFIQLFAIFLQNFHSSFQKENEDRIDRLNFIVASAIITEDMGELKSYKKLPWNRCVLRSIHKLFEDLKQIQRNTHHSENIIDVMTAEYKDECGGDSDLIKRGNIIRQRINSDSSDF